LNLRDFTDQYVVRAKQLQPAHGAPPDTRLPRFVRNRYMVLGRNSERTKGGDTAAALNTGINLAYVSCEPGKGFCSHKHPDWEIFVALSSAWKITVEDSEITIAPMDVVAVPGNVYHAAMNVGEKPGFMMSINMGSDTARYTIHPAILEELGIAAP
jgi:mannose-6-phosphate isomerase-like protein (cupin superfamily)